MIHPGPQNLDTMRPRCAIGGDPRKLDHHMIERGHFADTCRPAFECAARNVGHAAMVQHQGLAVTGPRQFRRDRELSRQKAHIERQTRRPDLSKVGAKPLGLRQIVRHHMQYPAIADHTKPPALVQPVFEPGIFLRAARRDLPQKTALADAFGHKPRLGLIILIVHAGFHEDGADNALSPGQGGIILKGKIAGGQFGYVMGPGIAEPVAVDHMLMGVDEPHLTSLAPLMPQSHNGPFLVALSQIRG